MWDCDAEGPYLVDLPPDEGADELLDGPQSDGVQCEERDGDVTTPTCNAWSTDGEATPLFSSKFPRQPDHQDPWHDEEPIRSTSASR